MKRNRNVECLIPDTPTTYVEDRYEVEIDEFILWHEGYYYYDEDRGDYYQDFDCYDYYPDDCINEDEEEYRKWIEDLRSEWYDDEWYDYYSYDDSLAYKYNEYDRRRAEYNPNAWRAEFYTREYWEE